MALLKTTIEADDIITIRTVQGFEIVAKFVSESSASIKVNKPLLVNGSSTNSESGDVKILWGNIGESFAALGDIEVNSVNILIAGETDSTIATQYTKQVS
jgi:hypothetical protein|tara:strand:- start:227 stop:526 length:300 start_codon:yes stop_codon:yes gene_type:complete